MSNKLFYDTETCGLYGMPVLIQYAVNDGEIQLYSPWTRPVKETLELIEWFMTMENIGFNLGFDHFMLCKLYTTFLLVLERLGNVIPQDHINEIGVLEKEARDGPCLKPYKAFDLMLHARKSEFQSTMNRGDIRIRRVPTVLAWQLAKHLDKTVIFDDILFAKRKNKLAPKFTVMDIKMQGGEIHPHFKDIVLRFRASTALKALAIHALKIDPDEVLRFGDVELHKKLRPKEIGYAPYALAVAPRAMEFHKPVPGDLNNGINWQKAWPEMIQFHIDHWTHHELARQYAMDDVKYTRGLYGYFGEPEGGDDDSELACMVAAVRWRGYALDIAGLKALKEEAGQKLGMYPIAPRAVRKFITEVLSPTEIAAIKGKIDPQGPKGAGAVITGKTNKIVLQDMANDPDWVCTVCDGAKSIKGVECKACNGTGDHAVKTRARGVLESRFAKWEQKFYDKLINAERLHADFNVIGALSSRMSGAGGVNMQGVKKTKNVRRKFPLAFGHMKLRGGDFDGFEVVLADAGYNDPDLRKDLLTCERCRNGIQAQVIPPLTKAIDFFPPEVYKLYVKDKIKNAKYLAKEEVLKAKGIDPKSPEANDVTVEIDEAKVTQDCAESYLGTFACPKCSSNKRMKIHALFGCFVFPYLDYDGIKATDGTANDLYTKSKSAVFAMLYGGEAFTLMTRLGVPIEVAEEAYKKFVAKYRKVGMERSKISTMFCSMRQEGGIGSKIVWAEPADYIESLLGFRRYFTLENMITKALFQIAEKPPEAWGKLKIKVVRRDREQTASGAVRSALFAAAFQLQAANMRAANNHIIQSAGATITKSVQRKVWDIQPAGINPWIVQPCNIHDEILVPTALGYEKIVDDVVNGAVESFRPKVPLIEMEFKAMNTWADK